MAGSIAVKWLSWKGVSVGAVTDLDCLSASDLMYSLLQPVIVQSAALENIFLNKPLSSYLLKN